jgi:GT2 family glycosyltransferase
VIHQFARTVDFPVKMTTHEHQGFRVALCRNDGVRASSGPYLLISDSDCLFPPHHLERHLQARKPGIIRAGNCFRLDRDTTECLSVDDVVAGRYRQAISYIERWRRWRRWISDVRYQLRQPPIKPKLMGFNIAISRSDLEQVNGFDEEYIGWGCEDDDFAARLRLAGKQVRTVVGYTQAYHMWHPIDPSHPGVWNQGANVHRLLNGKREIKCRKGLVELTDEQIENSVRAA